MCSIDKYRDDKRSKAVHNLDPKSWRTDGQTDRQNNAMGEEFEAARALREISDSRCREKEQHDHGGTMRPRCTRHPAEFVV